MLSLIREFLQWLRYRKVANKVSPYYWGSRGSRIGWERYHTFRLFTGKRESKDITIMLEQKHGIER